MECAGGNNNVIRGKLRLLLASSSVAALLLAAGTPAAFACTINVTGFVPAVSNSVSADCINVQGATVTTTVTNTATGTLTPGGLTRPNATGITINNSTVGGSVTNAGTITAPIATGIVVNNNSTVAGGVTNTGTISAGLFGVNVVGNTTFGGGISNGGTISVIGTGMIAAFVGTFSGGITNTGTLTGGGPAMSASGDLSFAGGITNGAGGLITGANVGVSVTLVSSFSGGISNAGTMLVHTGIFVDGGTTFSGGITNTGSITATNLGIGLGLKTTGGTFFGVTSFAGNISNAGTITAPTGIALVGSTINGAIVDSGTLAAGAHGILIDNASRINSTNTAIKITGPTFTGGISNAGVVSGKTRGIFIQNTATFGGGIANTGTMSSQGTTVRVDTVSQFSGGIANNGTVSGANIGAFIFTVSTFAGGISNTSVLSGGTNALAVGTVSNFSGGILNTGTISSPGGNGISVSNVATFGGNISNGGTITAQTGIKVLSNVAFAAGSTIVNSGTINGSLAAIDVSAATSPVTINQTGGAISGAIKLSANADVLNVSGGTINGNIVGKGSSDTINFALAGGTFTYNSAFTGINQVNINSGTVVLNGANSATKVDVNGGTLAGSGSIDPTLVTIHSGANFAPGTPGAPGTSMGIIGNLVFQPGSFYSVFLNPATTTVANVTGTASVAGTVNANFAAGSYLSKEYVILQSSGLSGTFSALTTTNLPVGIAASLGYTSDDVLLNLTATLGVNSAQGLNVNQQNVANALNNFFNSGGALPPSFATIFGLTDGALANALTQLDGELATGAERTAIQMTNEFLTLMLDPFVNGRGYVGGAYGGGGALGFAPDQQSELPPDVALAYAPFVKASPKPIYEPRWTAWGAAYGGSSNANGNATIGSNNVTASTVGGAAGMDYHLSPSTVVGFALGGGGTNWGLANALGNGHGDAFQAGAYGTTWYGPTYLAGALSFANHWFTTNRTALGDALSANFNGQSYGARLEGGYRFVALPTFGVTPYGAVQFQDFHTPSYSESDASGGGFGLSYAARNATDVRTELGARFDTPTLFYGKPLVLYGRVAWAHDFVSNPSLNAVFESLPGAGFTVFGAAIPHDSALTTAGAQWFLAANWSVIAKFDGEFAPSAQTYAGSGTLRYTW